MNDIESRIQIHFDGEIAVDHEISVRALGKCYLSFQKAFNRAFLDLKYLNGVYKHARMSNEDYAENELFVSAPEKGGYIANLFSRSKKSKDTADRVSKAINQVLNSTVSTSSDIEQQVKNRKEQLLKHILTPITFSNFDTTDDPHITRSYGDRSIAKEINEILSVIRGSYSGKSTVNFNITGNKVNTFDFDREKSLEFNTQITTKMIAKPVIYKSKIKSLDEDLLNGKFRNAENGKRSILRLTNKKDFKAVSPFLGAEEDIHSIGSPLIEFGAVEPNAGDIYFICLLSDYENDPGQIKIE